MVEKKKINKRKRFSTPAGIALHVDLAWEEACKSRECVLNNQEKFKGQKLTQAKTGSANFNRGQGRLR
jgi:hypothetical protein